MSIAPIQSPPPPELLGMRKAEEITRSDGVHLPDGKPSLGDAFAKVLTEAHATEATASNAAARFANGDPSIGIHEVVIASEKANITLRFATTLKNKAVEAYRELMNTQV